MSEPVLDNEAIVAALFTRLDGTFHWMLALPGAGLNGNAMRLHVINPEQIWQFDDSSQDLMHSHRLCTVVKIGSRRTREQTFTPAEVRNLLAMIELATPVFELARGVQNFTCRVWFRQAVRVLIEKHMVYCPRIKDLEDELLRLATPNAQRVFGGTPSCTYQASKTCSWTNKRFPSPTI